MVGFVCVCLCVPSKPSVGDLRFEAEIQGPPWARGLITRDVCTPRNDTCVLRKEVQNGQPKWLGLKLGRDDSCVCVP